MPAALLLVGAAADDAIAEDELCGAAALVAGGAGAEAEAGMLPSQLNTAGPGMV